MTFKNKTSMVRVFFLLDTLTFDQHILFLSEFFNGFSLEMYSTVQSVKKYVCH